MDTSLFLTPRIADRLSGNRTVMKATTFALFLISLYLLYRGFV